MISEVRLRYSAVQGRSLSVIFSFLTTGQLGWVALGMPAKTSIRASCVPRIFKEGRRNLFKKGILSLPNFWRFSLKIGFFTLFSEKNYQTSFLFASILSINRSNGFFGIAFARFQKFWISLFKNGNFN